MGFFSARPEIFVFHYEHPDGRYREISVPSGKGRFRRANKEAAFALAERRLSEQFDDQDEFTFVSSKHFG